MPAFDPFRAQAAPISLVPPAWSRPPKAIAAAHPRTTGRRGAPSPVNATPGRPRAGAAAHA